jgi:type II secretory pathway component PulF
MGWKIVAMVLVVLGTLLANYRIFRFIRSISSLREIVLSYTSASYCRVLRVLISSSGNLSRGMVREFNLV